MAESKHDFPMSIVVQDKQNPEVNEQNSTIQM